MNGVMNRLGRCFWLLGPVGMSTLLGSVWSPLPVCRAGEGCTSCPALSVPEGFEPYEWALGFGKNTKGAETYQGYESYTIYTVTRTDDYNPFLTPVPGTLRYGIEHVCGPRLIQFDVGGADIVLTGMLRLYGGEYVTLDGSAAYETKEGTGDGHGASVTGDEFSIFDSHDIVIRYLRFRSGRNMGSRYHCSRSLLIYGSCLDSGGLYPDWWDCDGNANQPTSGYTHDILVDHCSVEDSRDDNCNVWGACCRVTIQNCLIGGGVIGASKAMLIGNGIDADDFLTVCRNVITDTQGRPFDVGVPGRVDFYNNVMGNYSFGGRISSFGGAKGPRINYMNNFYRSPGIWVDGPNCNCAKNSCPPGSDPIIAVITTGSCTPNTGALCDNDSTNHNSIYISGNYYEYHDACLLTYVADPLSALDQWSLTGLYDGVYTTNFPTDLKKTTPHTTDASPESPEDIWDDLVEDQDVGCRLPLDDPDWDSRDVDLMYALTITGQPSYETNLDIDDVPGAVSNPTPANSSTVSEMPIVLSWTAGDETETYDVYFKTSGAGSYTKIGSDLTVTNITPSVSSNTTYLWYVVSKNSCYSTQGPTWTFSTGTLYYPE